MKDPSGKTLDAMAKRISSALNGAIPKNALAFKVRETRRYMVNSYTLTLYVKLPMTKKKRRRK